MHPYYSTVQREDLACDLEATYLTREVEAIELALVFVPGTG